MNIKIWQMFLDSEISISAESEETTKDFLTFCHKEGIKSLSGHSIINLDYFLYTDGVCYFYRKGAMGVTFCDCSVRPIKTYKELMCD